MADCDDIAVMQRATPFDGCTTHQRPKLAALVDDVCGSKGAAGGMRAAALYLSVLTAHTGGRVGGLPGLYEGVGWL